jgi:two-component system, NtrC family, response regulator AtoC
MTTLKEKIRNKNPMVGAAIGSGLSAKSAMNGNADFLMVLSAGHFRMQGCSSVAALMPYGNANEITWHVTLVNVMPNVQNLPVFVGTCAQDPNLHHQELFERVKSQNVCGITNFPSVGFIDGNYRQMLENTGLGYSREVELIAEASRAGLFTIAFVFSIENAVEMVNAGVDILCYDLGFAKSPNTSEQLHETQMDEAIIDVSKLTQNVRQLKPDACIMVFGGPVLNPRDCAQLYQHADINGYIGGSTFERFPASSLISQTVREFKAVAETGSNPTRLGALTGRGPKMQHVFETIQKVASTDVPVLIVGESGTGKELAARELHRLSLRRSKQMISCNCGALTETLAMSELFGHEKGAFTGASSRHLGRFEAAHRGTLFMDELTDLPLSVQASLLRVLQENEIVRVGATENIPVDVRLIAATNRNLADLINEGLFRLDLYYRLSTVVIRIPPLRERKEDIPFLLRELVQEFAKKYDYPQPNVPAQVMNKFLNHNWPGNIRELRNVVERCIIMGRGEQFRSEWLSDFYQLSAFNKNHGELPGSCLEKNNSQHVSARRILQETLEKHNGNKAAASRELGVTRKTIYNWLNENKLQNTASYS